MAVSKTCFIYFSRRIAIVAQYLAILFDMVMDIKITNLMF